MKQPLIPTNHTLHSFLAERGPLKSPLSAIFILALSCLAPSAQAQWIGAGTAGGTGGTDFNNTANWTNGAVSGIFSGNTTNATISLSSAATTLTDLKCNWAGSNTLTINGDGTGDNEVINLSGNIYIPTGSTATTVTIGSDVTLDLGTISTTRSIWAGGSVNNALVVNGILAGTSSGNGKIMLFNTAPGTLTLNNKSNTFDAPIELYGTLNFASIGNVGGGASALGSASTVAKGTIALGRNGILQYSGTVDQSSDRQISIAATQGPIGIGFTSTGSGKLTYSSNLAMGAFVGELRTYASLANSTLELDGSITSTVGGNTSLAVNYGGGVGTTILTSSVNNYTGVTTVNNGVLQVTKLADGGQASSIGTSSNVATNLLIDTYGGTGTLKYVGTGDSTDRLFTIRTGNLDASGSGAIAFTNTGAIALSAGRTTYSLTLTGVNAGDNLLAASLGDGGTSTVVHTTLNKKGVGKWILTGANSYTGATSVVAGTLQIGNGVAGSLNSSSAVSVAAGAFLAVNQATGSSFANTVANNGTINGAEGSGITNTFSGIISGTGAFNQTGAGVSILSNANTYTGATTVSAGELDVNGSTAANSAVSVNGGILGGSGTVKGNVVVTNGTINGNGLILAGASATTFSGNSSLSGTATFNNGISTASGILSITGTTTSNVGVIHGATLNNGGKVIGNVNVSGLLNGNGTVNGILTIKSGGELAPGNSPGTQTVVGDLIVESLAKVSMQLDSLASYDQISVTGAVTLAGTLDLTLGSITNGNVFTLIEKAGTSALISGTFGSVTVSGSAVTLSSSNTFIVGNQTYDLSYAGGDGNDLTLSVLAVPEPSTWAMLVGGIGMLALGRRLRRQAIR